MRLVFLLALVFVTPSAQAQFQIHAAVAPDTEGDTQGMARRPVVTLPGREVWVGAVVLDLPPASIQTVGLETDSNGGTALSLWLSDAAGQSFAGLTAERVGKALAVVYEGQVLTAPVVAAPVSNGLVMITGLDPDEAQRLADEIRRANGPQDPAKPIRLPVPPTQPPLGTGAVTIPRSPAPGPQPSAISTAGQAALRFADAVAARDWRTVSELLHPQSLISARASALSIMELDGGTVEVRSEGKRGSFVAADALGFAPSGRLSGLSDQDLATLYLAALDVLGHWGTPGPSHQVIGEVPDENRVHVLLRSARVDAVVSLVTLVRDGAEWRPLLTQPRGL